MTELACIQELRKQQDKGAKGIDECIQILTGAAPAIHCARNDWMASTMLHHAVDLLARTFPHLALDIADDELRADIEAMLEAQHPLIKLIDVGDATVHAYVGEHREDATCVDAAGWRVVASSPGQGLPALPQGGKANPASALLASSLLAARVLATIPGLLATKVPKDPTDVNLWHYRDDGPTLPDELLVDAHAFGHGSIGHAALAALHTWPNSHGTLTAIDFDVYEEHNPARYLATTATDVGMRKVDRLSEWFEDRDLEIIGEPYYIQDWCREHTDRPRIALIWPDNRDARAWAADTWPELAVSASASQDEAQVSVSSASGGICAYCTFTPEHAVQPEARHIIADFTGIPLPRVMEHIGEWNGQPSLPLSKESVRLIETARGKPEGTYDHWINRSLLDFMAVHQHERYSEASLNASGPDALFLPVPIVSAAAGALALAAWLRLSLEGLDDKASEFNHMRLNVWTGTLYRSKEEPVVGGTCLCQQIERQAWKVPAV